MCADNDVKVHKWSGENDYFFKGTPNSVMIGAGDGKFGIFLDGNLHRGRLDRCSTYVQWPQYVKDFKVNCLECYNFS